ncbi:rhomboid family intramembrane serine protease [Marinomonas sp. C2222]|uniref:Rhomboid family intramembrane serine protease n=1 Tax=Marinomonas sargassi TaxID=2984494 RepID=A0ABT2YTG7_9GAMM|nr:rhomboid family intramembrane serine protease [Marinomonas sargassi]MCV2403185.1 rhomboid family intramembrane serine protease [Marinomonas sargassi]
MPRAFLPYTVLYFVMAIWLVYILDLVLIGVDLDQFGIRPRTLTHIPSILLSPFLHSNLYHLLSNTVAILILGILVNMSVGNIRLRQIMMGGAIGSGIGIWLFSASGLVIGASGIVFSLLGFLLANAACNPTIRSWVAAIVAFLAYGGTLFSFAHFLPHISWAAHFWGFLSGILLAALFKKQST